MWDEYRVNDFKKFGFALLKIVARERNDDGPFNHLNKARFGVFSLEMREENPELFEEPIRLPAQNFKMKIHAYYENDFVEFIRNVFRSWK
jgi:hypothetical protein